LLWAGRLIFPTRVTGSRVRLELIDATGQLRPRLNIPLRHPWQWPRFSGELTPDADGGTILSGIVERQRARRFFRVTQWALLVGVGGSVLGIYSALVRGRPFPLDPAALIVVFLWMLTFMRNLEKWGEAYGAANEELLIGFIEAAVQGERQQNVQNASD
jgi:hypothetical protein